MKNTVKQQVHYLILLLVVWISGCTDLTEVPYDRIVKTNFYQKPENIIQMYVRSGDHANYIIQQTPTYVMTESSADQVGVMYRGSINNSDRWLTHHNHTWDVDFNDVRGLWDDFYGAITLVNVALDDFETLDPEPIGMSRVEFDGLLNGLRVLRAWSYLVGFDEFRNLVLAVSVAHPERNTMYQVTPQEIFDYLEKELKEALEFLPKKTSLGGNGPRQQQWMQAGAAAMLVRLYLNAEKWIGIPKYTECEEYCRKIINGDYGPYTISDRWDAPFDWDNDQCDEIIFGFGANYSVHRHYSGTVNSYMPRNIGDYFKCRQNESGRAGSYATRLSLQPSYDVDGNEYPFELGKPVAKFKKYPNDYRLKLYKNTSGQSREGMFLYGYLIYDKEDGTQDTVRNQAGTHPLYIRDQVGHFDGLGPDEIPENKASGIADSDENSGWILVKYPCYPGHEQAPDSKAYESDYAEIRLAEIYYSLAECRYRAGDKSGPDGAGHWFNLVRKRNYPVADHPAYLYQPEGSVVLTDMEVLDEWGREFIGERRRRTDLIRWNKYSSGTWWGKTPDADNHTEIFALHLNDLGANSQLKQNPGYTDISR
jgi:hypothetical protein